MSSFEILKLLLLFVSNWVSNMLLISYMKTIVSNADIQFPYPFLASCFVNISKMVLAILIALINRANFYMRTGKEVGLSNFSLAKLWCRGFFNCKTRLKCKDFVRGLLPIGLMMGIEVALSNAALHQLSVSLKTMLQSCSSAPVLLSGWLFGLEKLTFKIQLVILLVVGGGVLSAYGRVHESSVSYSGLAMAMLSLFAQGFRVSFTQLVLKRKGKLSFDEDTRQTVLSKISGDSPSMSIKDFLLQGCLVCQAPPKLRASKSESIPTTERMQEPSVQHRFHHSSTIGVIPAEVLDHMKAHAGLKVAYVTKPEILMVTTPSTAAVCLVLSLIFESGAFHAFLANWRAISTLVILCSVYGLAKLITDLALIQRTSAVVFILSGNLNDLLLILCGVLFFDERPPLRAWLGFGVTSFGMIFYAWQLAKAAGGEGGGGQH